MSWYTHIWHNEQMRVADPFGYGMGLVIGYVLIPVLLAGCLGLGVWIMARRKR